jgi:hypothetical protein
MVTEPESSRRAEAEAPLTQHVGGVCFAVMLLDQRYEVGLLDGPPSARSVRWFILADDAIRAEVWRMLGQHVEVYARGGVVQRVEMP